MRKNRIPLYLIKQMGNLLEISPKEIENNIETTDREIAEII